MSMPKVCGFVFKGCAAILLSVSLFLPSRSVAEEKESHAGTLKSWDLYGSVRLGSASWTRYKWYNDEPRANDPLTGLPTDSSFQLDSVPVKRLFTELQYNSYFGVRGKGEKFGFRFEMGWVPTIEELNVEFVNPDFYQSQKKRDGIRLRKIYGEWFINEYVTLLIGQDWNIANFFISNQIFYSDAGLGYCGALYTGRRPQLRVSVGSNKNPAMPWKVEVAAIKPDTFIVGLNYPKTDAEEKLPKVELGLEGGYKLSEMFGARGKLVVGMARYDLVLYPDRTAGVSRRETVKSDLLGFNVDVDVWKFRLSGVYARGKNMGAYGVWMGNPYGSRTDVDTDLYFPLDDVDPADTTGIARKLFNANSTQWAAVASCRPLAWLTAEGGMGMINSDHEAQAIKNRETSPGALKIFERTAYYANLQIAVADGHFLIVPEFSFSDFGGKGGRWYATGLKLQLDI